MLVQEQEDGSIRPLAYVSCSLLKHEQSYGVTELEALDVVWTFIHFRPYLYGYQCDVYTDHKALQLLLNISHPSCNLTRRGIVIQKLDLHIHY